MCIRCRITLSTEEGKRKTEIMTQLMLQLWNNRRDYER